jgi:hypothetical protein
MQVLLIVTQSPQTFDGQVLVLVCVMLPLWFAGQLRLWTWVSGWQACGQLGEIHGKI